MPKILGEHLAEHRELTRRRLFDALAELMTEMPFSAITMSQIAAQASVGRTAIYNHFADKDAILLAYMRETTAEFAQVLSQALEGQDDALQELRIYVRSYMELKEHFHLMQAMDLRANVSPENATHLHDHAAIVEHALTHILQTAIDQGCIPAQNVRLLVALVHSSMSGVTVPTAPEARENVIRKVQTFILRAVGVSEVPSPTELVEGEDSQRTSDAEAFLRCPAVF